MRPYVLFFPLLAAACATTPSGSLVERPMRESARAHATVMIAPADGAPLPADTPAVVARAAAADDRAVILEQLLPENVRDRVAREVSSDVAVHDLELRHEGDSLVLTAAGEGQQSALARCTAWLRAATARESTEGSAAIAWLEAEGARATKRVVEINASLRDIPSAPAVNDPMSRDELLVAARIRSTELAAMRHEGKIADASFPLLRSVVHARFEAEAAVLELHARGLGDAHPNMLSAHARAASLKSQQEALLDREVRATDARIAALEQAPKGAPGEKIVRELMLARLDELPGAADVVVSDDPVLLQTMAMEETLERASLAALMVTDGDENPRVLVARSRIDAIDNAFDGARQDQHIEARVLAAAGQEEKRVADLDTRPQALLEEVARLAALLTRLGAWTAAARAGAFHVKIVEGCTAP